MSAALPDTEATRAAMIEACRQMNARGINQGTSGNISVRVEGALLITPSGVPYDEMRPEDMVMIPLDGPPEGPGQGKPSTEWPFHQRLHQTRPDMPVVLHAHPPYCTVLAIQRRPIPACHYMVAAFGGTDVPVAGYALYGSDALADSMAKLLTDRHACLMANHGATVLGEDITRALWRLEELETLARSYVFATLGDAAPYILSDAEMSDVITEFASYGPHSTETQSQDD